MINDHSEVIDSDYLLSADSQEEQRAFYKKTYSHVAVAFLVFLLLEFILLSIPAVQELAIRMTQGWTWLIVLGAFMFATRYAESTVAKADTRGKQYLGFFIYILAEAFIFVPLLMIGLAVGGSAILLQAFYLTLALFIGLSLVVFMTKKDFSFLRSAITIGGVIAMGLIVVGMIFGFDLGLWFSVGMVVLAAGSILYQTSNLIHKYNRDQYVLASLGLFASFMLLLWYILSILLDRS
jgi:FtsH-binding integral membrane protein